MTTGILQDSNNMALSAISPLAILFALSAFFYGVSGSPEPEPSPVPEPFYGCCTCRPPSCCIPACRASTTTCGILVVPTMSTVHTKGCTKCCDCCGGGCCGGCCGGCGGCCGGGCCGGNCGSGCGSMNYGGQCCACT